MSLLETSSCFCRKNPILCVHRGWRITDKPFITIMATELSVLVDMLRGMIWSLSNS